MPIQAISKACGGFDEIPLDEMPLDEMLSNEMNAIFDEEAYEIDALSPEVEMPITLKSLSKFASRNLKNFINFLLFLKLTIKLTMKQKVHGSSSLNIASNMEENKDLTFIEES